MRYLVDTSALVRIIRGQVDPSWDDLVERGLLAVCEPVIVETLAMADAKTWVAAAADIRATYPWVPVPDNAWTMIAATQRDLAAQSQHQGLSVADHLVVATALKLKLTVLHEDADFETVGRVVPHFLEQRLTTAE